MQRFLNSVHNMFCLVERVNVSRWIIFWNLLG